MSAPYATVQGGYTGKIPTGLNMAGDVDADW